MPKPEDWHPVRTKRKRSKKSLEQEVETSVHNIFTHFPKDPNCEVCNACKCARSRCMRKQFGKISYVQKPVEFADAVTADHSIINEEDQSRFEDQVALIITDKATGWEQSYPAKSNTAEESVRAFQQFLGPIKPKNVYTDNSPELIKAMKDLQFPHDTSTPHRPQTNGVAERAVRRVKEGTSCALTQSGLSNDWWAEAMKTYCFQRVAVDKLANGKTAHHNRFKENFEGPLIPFGAEIQYKPITDKDKAKLHKFGEKVLSGIFVGYHQRIGGGLSGDLEVADWEAIETLKG